MHETTMQVRWAECDPYDHLNHAAYLTFFETARIEALDAIGWGMRELRARGLHIVVAEITVRFRRPAEFEDIVRVRTTVDEIRPASAVWRQVMDRNGDDLAHATVIGAITDVDGRLRRMPPGLVEAMSRLGTGGTGRG